MGQIGCPETSVSNYQPTLHDVPGKRRPYILSHPCIDANRHSLYNIWSYIQYTYPQLYLQALHKVYTHTHIHTSISSFSGWRWAMLARTTLTYIVTQNAGWSVLCRMAHTYHLRTVTVGSKWKSGWGLRLRWDAALPGIRFRRFEESVTSSPGVKRQGGFLGMKAATTQCCCIIPWRTEFSTWRPKNGLLWRKIFSYFSRSVLEKYRKSNTDVIGEIFLPPC
jgi:hypothetical protein